MSIRNFIYIFSDTEVSKLVLIFQDQSPGFFYHEAFHYKSDHLPELSTRHRSKHLPMFSHLIFKTSLLLVTLYLQTERLKFELSSNTAQITKLVSTKAKLQTQFQSIFKSRVLCYYAVLPSQSPCSKSSHANGGI